jgi:hypothetical protein
MIRSNRRLTIREIVEDLNISYSSVQNILTTDLNMRQVSVKFDNALSHIASGTAISVKQKYYGLSSYTLFIGSGTLRLLALPQSQNGHER